MQAQPCIGVDVSMAAVDVASHDGSVPARKVENSASALRGWLKQLPPGSRIAVEATGTLHRLLVSLAHAAGFTVYVLNPAQLSYYARSVGRRAKTDRLDAELIARYLANEHAHLHPWQPPSALQQEIDDLVRRRATLVAQRVALRQSFKGVTALGTVSAQLDKAFGKAVEAVDKQIKSVVAKNDVLAAQCARLRAIPGIGHLIAVALANRLGAIPFRSADAAVAFIGLDPRTRESGTYRGQKKLSKRGDAELRRLLYVAAMAAARNPQIAPLVQSCRRRGLSAIAAYNVLARRLLRSAWSLLKYEGQFAMTRFVGA
jgi:transposase